MHECLVPSEPARGGQALSAWTRRTAVSSRAIALRQGRHPHLDGASWLLLLRRLGGGAAGRGGAVCRRCAGLVLKPNHNVAVRKVEVGVRLHRCRDIIYHMTTPHSVSRPGAVVPLV